MSEEKSRLKKILHIALPLILANSFWNLQLTIDRVYLGKLSTESLGAAMAVMGVFWVPMALLQQTASYVMAFVAQYYGADEKNKIGSSVWQSIYVSIIGGILLLAFNFYSSDFFKLIGHSEKIQELEVVYYNSIAFSALPTALMAAISGFFTGLGRTKIVTTINLVGLILNVILDYLLIFGNFGFPKLGIEGAGIATTIANYGAAFYGIFLAFTNENETIYKMKSSYKIDFKLIKQFLKFGIPNGLQWALEGMAFTVFLIIMGNMKNGEANLAASSIAVTIMMLAVLPSMGVAQAVMTLVGQLLGNKEPEEAEKVTYGGIKISSIYMLILGISFFLIPEFYISWFENKENLALWLDTEKIAIFILKVVAFFTLLDSIYFNISFAIKGAGDTRFVSIIALTLPWPLFVLPTYLVRNMDNAIQYAWLFVAVYAIVITSTIFLRFKQGKWKSMLVIKQE
jgi:multidrug resistance protein, MATE family